jgi:hypothetical protein
MGDRVVIENYPAMNLPDDLRGKSDPTHRVRVTVEDDTRGKPERSLDSLMQKIDDYRRDNPGKAITTEEAVARVRALRDEWD